MILPAKHSPCPPPPQGSELIAQGRCLFPRLQPYGQGVEDRSRFLCAALSSLAAACYRALGGRAQAAEVSLAAAMLALLTKMDDDVIDSLPFHGGPWASRQVVRRRARSFLAPTLASLIGGRPTHPEPRCHLAADLGQRLRSLAAGADRLERLIHWVSRGWEIQARSLAVLTCHPSQVSPLQVDHATSDISGAWLLMITLVGTLPADTGPLRPAEEAAFFAWGGPIQRADALADLAKDMLDGHCSTYPGHLLYRADPQAYMSAFIRQDTMALHGLMASHQADLACLPAPGAPLGGLSRLGQVGPILRWILGFLLWRYLTNEHCPRSTDDPAFAPWLGQGAGEFAPYINEVRRLLKPSGEGLCLEH